MIHIIKKLPELLSLRKKIADLAISVGFVPTMGNLHEGHLSLLEQALNNHDCVFLSIFVNPTQFGPQEDFQKYPRTQEADIQKISALLSAQTKWQKKQIYVFCPETVEDVYPAGFSSVISVGELSTKYCGHFRPGHFDGVATVVYLLFSLVTPDAAYFGTKDFQQILVIEKMVRDLRLNIKIVRVPTIRQENGLALSSRNQYLKGDEKEKSLHLIESLKAIQNLMSRGPWSQKKDQVQKFIDERLQNETGWDYLAVCRQQDLLPPQDQDKKLVIIGAYRLGQTRLIDNLLLEI